MTCGIYCLFWEEYPENVYVGKSTHIESRFPRHLADLKNKKHSNYKLQNVFNKLGNPQLLVLEECSPDDLNTKELFWQQDLNSLENGLDIVTAGQGGYGPDHVAAKYSKLQILQVFRLLQNSSLIYKDISLKTSVSESMIKHIALSQRHLWLSKKYPKLYIKMVLATKQRILNKERKNSIRFKLENLPIICKNGLEVTVTNTTRIAKQIGIDQGNLSRLINGKAKSTNGWVLKSNTM